MEPMDDDDKEDDHAPQDVDDKKHSKDEKVSTKSEKKDAAKEMVTPTRRKDKKQEDDALEDGRDGRDKEITFPKATTPNSTTKDQPSKRDAAVFKSSSPRMETKGPRGKGKAANRAEKLSSPVAAAGKRQV